MRNLYALLVGINAYPKIPLSQCVADVAKVKSYLDSIKEDFGEQHIFALTDDQANKANVVQHIQEELGKAEDGDTVLFYYSGHGAQEKSGGVFPTEHDGLLECLVCHAKEDEENYLLADKELRFLFSNFKNNPHIVTVFDSCHSGDSMRNLHHEDSQDNVMKRRMSHVFDQRDYSHFVFGDQIDAAAFKSKHIDDVIPQKPHVHMAACLSSESAWEDTHGGVFTRYLLQLLEHNNHAISYKDISKFSKISLKGVTQMVQTPKVEVVRGGQVDIFKPWLNLDRPVSLGGKVRLNTEEGWFYSHGKLMGIEEGMEIEVSLNEDRKGLVKVLEVDLEKAKIENLLDKGLIDGSSESFKRVYDAKPVHSTYAPLNIAINNLDANEETETELTDILKDIEHVELTSQGEANFHYVIFNDCLYLSRPGDGYRPLTAQIDLLEDDVKLKDIIQQHMKKVVKWQHYDTLHNPEHEEEAMIKIHVAPKGDDQWLEEDYVNETLKISSNQRSRVSGKYKQTIQVKIESNSDEAIFVTAYFLSDDFEIVTQSLFS
ncbi:MAG: caspase family protein, partial [Bacteroidota bacterium]